MIGHVVGTFRTRYPRARAFKGEPMNKLNSRSFKYQILMAICATCLVVGCPSEGFSKDSTEVDMGGITYHIFDSPDASENYTHKLADNGKLIYNPLFGIKYTHEDIFVYDSYAAFAGQNSVGGAIMGGLYSFGVFDGPLQLGVALGAYKQDDEIFLTHNILPPISDIGGVELLAGFECNYKIMLDYKNFIKFNSYLFPDLLNFTVGFGGYF